MAVFRIRKNPDGGFTVVGTLGSNRHLVARKVRKVDNLDEAAEAVEEMAQAFMVARLAPWVDASSGK